ncbi:MAG: Starvation sensing protein RspA, partial [uncultured Thermomicrobiales bacterium]
GPDRPQPDRRPSAPGARRHPGLGAVRRAAAAPHHRRPGDHHRAGRHPARDREGRNQRARALRRRLRDVHAASPDGRHRGRGVPQAVPGRPRPRRHRGHLADLVRQLLLAVGAGPQQRDVRRRHGPLGHQGQAGEHARPPAARRQGAARGPALRPRVRTRPAGGRGAGACPDGAGLPLPPRPGRRARLQHLRRERGHRCPDRRRPQRDGPDRLHPEAHQPPRPEPDAVGAVRLLPRRAPPLRPSPQPPRRRGRAAPRHPRARPTDPGDRPRPGARALQALLPRGPLRPRGQRLLPPPPPADLDPDRDGRTLCQPGRVPAADPGTPDRLHPGPHLRHRGPHPGPQARRALRVLRRPHRLARPWRRLARRPCRQPPARPGRPELRHPGVLPLP